MRVSARQLTTGRHRTTLTPPSLTVKLLDDLVGGLASAGPRWYSCPVGFTIRPLTPERWPALEQLFGKAGASNGCWCMYWRLGPRYHERQRELNRQDRRQLAASAPASGLLAYDGDIAVGWAELAPRADLPWLNQTRFLRPVDDLPVWSVPCFYVRRTHRGLGVMGALIAGAVQAASAAGAPAVESYPVDTQMTGHTGNLFPGVASIFAAHGFEVIARRKPDRPVMRRSTGGRELR